MQLRAARDIRSAGNANKPNVSNWTSSGLLAETDLARVPELITLPFMEDIILPPATENWDNENVGTYDPMEYVEKRVIVRCLIRASKHKKKKFRKIERERVNKHEFPFLNNLKTLTIKDDDIWEELSSMCQLSIQDHQISDEVLRQKLMEMKISYS